MISLHDGLIDRLDGVRANGDLAAKRIVQGPDEKDQQTQKSAHQRCHPPVHAHRAHIEEEGDRYANDRTQDHHPPERAGQAGVGAVEPSATSLYQMVALFECFRVENLFAKIFRREVQHVSLKLFE